MSQPPPDSDPPPPCPGHPWPAGVRIGTAGWTIPAGSRAAFAGQGSHLQRYAARLDAVEINSSFYRPHRPATYARWAASVPEGFAFAVKLPRLISHRQRLSDAAEPLAEFLQAAGRLGAGLGPILVQLPPSLRYDQAVAEGFFGDLRRRHAGPVACEPRHPGWFTDAADALLQRFEVARVAADPAVVPEAARPGGFPGLVYYRMHGSPEVYHSAYRADRLAALRQWLASAAAGGAATWCIFDNTARGFATGHALEMREAFRLSRHRAE